MKEQRFTSGQIGQLDKVRHRLAIMLALAAAMTTIVVAAVLLSRI